MAMRLYWVMGGSGLGNPHPNSGTLDAVGPSTPTVLYKCRVAKPLLAFAPTDPIVRLSRNGLFRRVTRGHARAPNQRWWMTGFGRGKTVRSSSNHSQVRFAL